MDRLNIDNILKIDKLQNELELEKASSIHGKLRWMVKKDASLEPIRNHLFSLIEKYESIHWKDVSQISDKQVKESDIAENIVAAENVFNQKRKAMIKDKLKEQGMAQKDLAKLLGHRANYMSELMNGVRPFSKEDLVVIHRLFDIDFKYLIPPFLKREVEKHIMSTLEEMNIKRLTLTSNDIEYASSLQSPRKIK